MLSRVAGEDDGAEEALTSDARARFNETRWVADARLTRYAALVALVLHPIGGLTDYAIIGVDPRLWPLLGLRLAASAIHIPILLACSRPAPSPSKGGQGINRLVGLAFALSVIAGVLGPTTLRPTSVASQGGPLLLILVLYALVFPVWRERKITAFMIASAVYVAIGFYWRARIGYGGAHELITISIFLVAIGTLIPRVNQRIEQLEFDRFTAQDELTRTIARLQREVALREERELALDRARRAAEEASKAKTSFMASVSHELRTPLVGILGVAELMRDAEARREEETRERIELLRQSGEYLLGLVNDLLDYFKIEAGKLALRELPVSPRAFAKAAQELVKPRVDAAGITLTVTVSPELPVWILGDPLRLQQILLNLLGNAVKFTERGGVSVELYPADEELVLIVADTGVGMAPEVVERVFEPFEQAENARGRARGTGLGLTITRRFVEQMRGSIDVRSKLGQGTTVTVRLPLVESAPPREEVSGTRRLEPGRALRILVGEDHRVSATITKAMLQKLGHRVTLARDGGELVERATAERFDVVLTDMHMPVLDGAEATKRIRASPYNGETPVLALTADAFESNHATLLAAGVDDVLVKPISGAALAKALAEHTQSA